MSVFQAFILGIVQGIAEFLPISSSGHLTIFQTLLGLEAPSFFFDVLLHVATLVPIFIVYRKELFALIKKPFQKTTYLLVIATLPTVAFVLLFGDITDKLFATGAFLPFSFALTGVFLLFADYMTPKCKDGKDVGYIEAFVIGCMQAIGSMPGVSRSGSTIAGALATKVDREKAAQFSFLMAIPAIAGALVLQLVDLFKGEVVIGGEHILPIVVGCLAAMVSGFLSINILLQLIKRAKLRYFAYYVFAVAIFVFVTQIFFGVEYIVAG